MPSSENAQNQLVVLNPASVGDGEKVINGSRFPNCILGLRSRTSPPSIKRFTVQCAHCRQWRLVPKDNYEEIQEHTLERPFLCKAAKEWGPDIACDNPSDIVKDKSTVWAMDKCNFPHPPLDWEWRLTIRGAGGTKFANVHLQENPEEMAGVSISKFSFEAPKPLQQNYLRKHCAPTVSEEGYGVSVASSALSKLLNHIDPVSYAAPVGKEKIRHNN